MSIKCHYEKGYLDDAGLDVMLDEPVTLKKGTNIIELDLHYICNIDRMAYLVERTSAAIKGILVHQCPIDPNYCGKITAIVENLKDDITYNKGEAFCQLVVIPMLTDKNIALCRKKGIRTTSKMGGTNEQNTN